MDKETWFNKGKKKYDNFLRVPSTPGGVLANRIRKKLNENEGPFKILVQEMVGNKIKNITENSKDPWKGSKCGRISCIFCRDGIPGDCWTQNATYQLTCKPCISNEVVASYTGESGRSLFSRISDHDRGLRLGTGGNPLHKHNIMKHSNTKMTMEDWEAKKTGTYRTAMQRQISEGILLQDKIRMSRDQKKEKFLILNSKLDHHQAGVVCSLPRKISSELE